MPTPTDSRETISACRSIFLQRLGTLLEGSGTLSAPAIQAIQRGLAVYFDEVIASTRRASFREEAGGMTASRLTLVGEDDLELELRLDNLSTRLFEDTGGDLWKIHLRFVTLLKRTDLAKTQNPVGPNAIVRGLKAMFDAAGAITLDKKLDLLERIENRLQQELPAVYAEINDFLESQGAETAQPSIISSVEVARKDPVAGIAVSESTLLALQEALRSRLPAMRQTILKEDGGAAGALMTQATLERLIFRLDELDRQGGFTPTASSHRLETLIPGLFSDEEAASSQQPTSLSAAELGVPVMAPEGLAIDTLAMIFALIFDHPKLPDALKAVISSLQIIMLKLAIQDPTFFTDAEHPARLLIDRMGVAMLGLPVDIPVRHPVCQRLFEIAGQLRSGSKGDIAAIKAALAQVDALIAERNASIASAAQPYIPLLEQLDRHDQAVVESRQTLDNLIARGVPVPIREFLDNTWRRVLALVLSEYGPQSSQWQAYNKVIEDLLWTFQPKASVEDRKALAKRLPEILKLLKAGMERVEMPTEVQAAFLDASFSLQTQALRTGQGASMPETTETKNGEAIEANGLQIALGKPVAGELRLGARLLRTLDFTSPHPPPSRPLACQPGDWLEIRLADGESCVAQLYYLSPTSLRALFYNPDRGRALAMHVAILDKQLQDGVAQVCSSSSLFDAAARQALQQTTKA